MKKNRHTKIDSFNNQSINIDTKMDTPQRHNSSIDMSLNTSDMIEAHQTIIPMIDRTVIERLDKDENATNIKEKNEVDILNASSAVSYTHLTLPTN